MQEWAEGGVRLPDSLHKGLPDPGGSSEDATPAFVPLRHQSVIRFPQGRGPSVTSLSPVKGEGGQGELWNSPSGWGTSALVLKSDLGNVTRWPPFYCDYCGPQAPQERGSQNNLGAGMNSEEKLFRVQRGWLVE